MNKQDVPELAKIINLACEVTGRKPLSNEAVGLYARIFKEYSIEQIRAGVQDFLTSDDGRFPLTPSAILGHIGTGHLDADMIVQMAKQPTCVTGYMARKLIGTWDLEHNAKQAMTTARSILKTGELEREVSRIKSGEMTKTERARLTELNIETPTSHRLENDND